MTDMDTITIISGGQTGVDRGALDAALDFGAPCGGWCPEGRKAGDGVISDRYPLKELIGAGYRKRTRQNVIDSDATVIIYFERIIPKGGTEQTIKECEVAKKPHLLIDGSQTDIEIAATNILKFCMLNGVRRLNLAGPGGKGLPQAHAYTQKAVQAFLTLNREMVPSSKP